MRSPAMDVELLQEMVDAGYATTNVHITNRVRKTTKDRRSAANLGIPGRDDARERREAETARERKLDRDRKAAGLPAALNAREQRAQYAELGYVPRADKEPTVHQRPVASAIPKFTQELSGTERLKALLAERA